MTLLTDLIWPVEESRPMHNRHGVVVLLGLSCLDKSAAA